MKASHIKVEHLKNPLGIDLKKPFISWCCQEGLQQTGYLINAFSYWNNQKDELIYTSGKQNISTMSAYLDTELKSRQRVLIEITLFDENNKPGEVSTAVFETALLNQQDWCAKWINPEPENLTEVNNRPASYLKRTFSVEETEPARLYITAHGLYTVFLNSTKVGNAVLTPGTSEYSVNLEYQTYDVTSYLKKGDNEIQIILGDGWYRGKSGMNNPKGNLFGTDIACLAQLEVNKKVVLKTEGSWIASQKGPVQKNGLDFGETVDANLGNGFFATEEFHPVRVENFSYKPLKCSNNVPITEHEVFQGKRIVTPREEDVLDFGQNMAGYVSFSVTAKAGQKITLTHGEALDENGNFTIENFQGPTEDKQIPQKIVYLCKEGKNEYKPQFCLFGFQYVKVETDLPLDEISFQAHAVYSDMEQVGQFQCGSQEVNQLVQNSLWSMKSNFADIPTDCPTRERQGWTGDAALFVSTGTYLMDCYSVFRKWLAEVRVAQLEDGKIPGVAPRSEPTGFFQKLSNGSAGWADAITIVPSVLSQVYQCPDILSENYDAMRKWVDFSQKRAKKSRLKAKWKRNPYQHYIVDTGFHWGEWMEPGTDIKNALAETMKKGNPEVPTAYFAYSAQLLALAAERLNKKEDAFYYQDLSKKIKKAYRAYFVKEGHIVSDRQARYVRPIALDILTLKEKKKAAQDLNELVIQNDYHLNTGFLSTPYLCEVLSSYGYTDTAYRLLLQDTAPSWLYEVKKGATTIWETWNGIDEQGKVSASLNHYSYGAVTGWLFKGVAGIQLSDGKIIIKPHPHDSIGFVNAVYQSPVGQIQSSWRYEGKTIHYEVKIPSNTSATVILPNGKEHQITAGTYSFTTQEI